MIERASELREGERGIRFGTCADAGGDKKPSGEESAANRRSG